MEGYVGSWRITEMEEWDNNYINMETQAHIEIDKKGHGTFQFALVMGNINGEIQDICDEKRFNFTWEGSEEYDQISGNGWLKLVNNNELNGHIKFHSGDGSLFKAKRREHG